MTGGTIPRVAIDVSGEPYIDLEREAVAIGLAGLFTPEDVSAIADGLPADASALAVLFEHRWAERLKGAMASAGGFLVSRTTVPPEVLEAINAELEAAVA